MHVDGHNDQALLLLDDHDSVEQAQLWLHLNMKLLHD